MPVPFDPNNRAFQHEVARQLRRRLPAGRLGSRAGAGPGIDGRTAPDHPVAGCPDRAAHVRAAVQVERIERELARPRPPHRGRAGSLARRFDAVLRLLEAWGYLRRTGRSPTRGELLVRTFHESDLLIAEAVAVGPVRRPRPAALAGARCRAFTYEHRSRIPPPPPWFPSAEVRSPIRAARAHRPTS